LEVGVEVEAQKEDGAVGEVVDGHLENHMVAVQEDGLLSQALHTEHQVMVLVGPQVEEVVDTVEVEIYFRNHLNSRN
jgi:hypothetical protein